MKNQKNLVRLFSSALPLGTFKFKIFHNSLVQPIWSSGLKPITQQIFYRQSNCRRAPFFFERSAFCASRKQPLHEYTRVNGLSMKFHFNCPFCRKFCPLSLSLSFSLSLKLQGGCFTILSAEDLIASANTQYHMNNIVFGS